MVNQCLLVGFDEAFRVVSHEPSLWIYTADVSPLVFDLEPDVSKATRIRSFYRKGKVGMYWVYEEMKK